MKLLIAFALLFAAGINGALVYYGYQLTGGFTGEAVAQSAFGGYLLRAAFAYFGEAVQP